MPSATDIGAPSSRDGDASLPQAELPADFPVEIPLESGHIVKAHVMDSGWGVVIGVPDAEASGTAIPASFVASGFEQMSWKIDPGLGGSFISDRYMVTVSFVPDSRPGIEAIVSYGVVKTG